MESQWRVLGMLSILILPRLTWFSRYCFNPPTHPTWKRGMIFNVFCIAMCDALTHPPTNNVKITLSVARWVWTAFLTSSTEIFWWKSEKRRRRFYENTFISKNIFAKEHSYTFLSLSRCKESNDATFLNLKSSIIDFIRKSSI